MQTSANGKELQVSHRCLVYSQVDGRVVHIHEFIGKPESGDKPDKSAAREKLALEHAERICDKERVKKSDLKVLHNPPEFERKTGKEYRVDVKSGKLHTGNLQ